MPERVEAWWERRRSAWCPECSDILDHVLSHSLNRGDIDVPINEGRKRIDLTWVNHAEDGFFRWLSIHYRAAMVFAECKNYKDDPGNPEFDRGHLAAPR